jgi:hypothetical protein
MTVAFRIKTTLFLLLTGLVLCYAGETGKIAGQVTSQDNKEPLIGANVMLVERWENGKPISLLGSGMQGAVTDANGEYYIINVKPGVYSLRFNYIGFQTITKTQVRVSVDLTTRMDIKLSTTVLDGQSVDVIADRVQIQKDLTSSEVSVHADKIDMMPVRSVTDLVNLQAGVIKDNSGNLHIRGGRTSEIAYMVDGVKVQDPLNRSMGINIDDQAIEELKTITGTFNAEYGQALSGIVNIVTKQGSDEFHFNATGYMGDHLSYDDDTYYVMDNPEWAHAAARALTRKSRYLVYDFGGINPFTSENQIKKPWLTRKSYLDSYDPTSHSDLQLNISGPLPFTNKKISYFISGRGQNGPGYVYGRRYFMPWGFSTPVADTVHAFKTADNALTPLSTYTGYSTQSKINWDVTGSLHLSYGLYYNYDQSYSAGWAQKYVPDAGKNYLTRSQTHIFSTQYVISTHSFLDLKASWYQKRHKNYLYEDPHDYRYMPYETAKFQQYVYGKGDNNDLSIYSPVNDFSFYGNAYDLGREAINYLLLKGDFTSQVTKRHLVKTGFSLTQHDLENEYYQLQFSDLDYRPIVPETSSPYHVLYSAKPKEMAAYLQDKIEFNELIINIGLRWDYFDPDGRILADPMDPQIYSPFKMDNIYSNYSPTKPDSELIEYTVEQRRAFWYKKAKVRTHLSPRFGLSFPVTDKGVIHFSYGWFFQNPEFQYLYNNPNFWIDGAGSQNLVGNADLNSERTIMYELGLQQQLTQDLYMHVTGFYRDIRDWVGTGTPIDTYKGKTYYQYVNKDHAAAKGLTVSAGYRLSNLAINLDYTYMTAKGTSSDPQDAYNDAMANEAPRIQMINLNWDQRQALNLTFNYTHKEWMVTLLNTMNSGLPYTPTFARGEVSGSGTFVGLRENSERRPVTYNTDLRFGRNFNLGNYRMQLYCNVNNLLDLRNALTVYSDTGQADYTLQGINQQNRAGNPDLEISRVEEYFTQPWYYSAPRYIQFGLRISK